MKKNVGTLDASIRITAGLLGLAYGIGRMNRRPHRTPWLLMSLSAMKVAEGVTRFCPMLYSMGTNTRNEAEMGAMMGRVRETGENMMEKTASTVKKAAQTITPGAEELINAVTPNPPYTPHIKDEHLYPTYS